MTTRAFTREQTISSPFTFRWVGAAYFEPEFLVLLLVRIVVGAGSLRLPCLLIAQFRNFSSRHSLLTGLLWHADSKGFPAYQAVFNHDLSWRGLCRFVLLYSAPIEVPKTGTFARRPVRLRITVCLSAATNFRISNSFKIIKAHKEYMIFSKSSKD